MLFLGHVCIHIPEVVQSQEILMCTFILVKLQGSVDNYKGTKSQINQLIHVAVSSVAFIA